MIWEAWCADRPGGWYAVVRLAEPRRAEARRRFATASEPERQWVEQALTDDTRKWLAAAVLEAVGNVPNRFFDAMLRAGVYEGNPSFNRTFIRPCVETYGQRRVIETLLGYLEHGGDREKAGAASALYWANPPLAFRGNVPALTPEHATPESRARYEALADLRSRERALFLREFVRNSNIDVRRRIIPRLNLDPNAYPPDLRPLVAEAIRIARAHPDEYIRHRLGAQLGAERVLSPLPPMGSA